MLTRWTQGTTWILCIVLIFASLDTVPDLPAVDPHAQAVKARAPGECAEARHACANSELHCDLALAESHGTIFVRDTEPDCPPVFLARTGQASDTSPPVRANRFQK